MGATEFEKPLDNDLAAINTNLGSPTSASGVTGADAFTKINTLNSKLTVTEATGLYSGIRVYKTGNVVQITVEGFSAEQNYAANATIFTLPEGYRPLYSTSFLDTLNSGKRICIDKTGIVYCTSAISSGGVVRGGCSFVV